MIAECDALQRAIDTPALLPRVILADLTNSLAQQGELMPKSGSAFIRSVQRIRVAHGGHTSTPGIVNNKKVSITV